MNKEPNNPKGANKARKIMVCGLNQLGLCEEKGFDHATEVPWDVGGKNFYIDCCFGLSFTLIHQHTCMYTYYTNFIERCVQSSEKPVRVVAGHGTSFVITRIGNLFSWGQDRCGVLGHGDKNLSLRVPRQVMALNRRKILEIATGMHHALAIDDECKVWGWGKNCKGQCGLRFENDMVLTPTELPDFNVNQYPIQMSCGQEHNLFLVKALRKDGATIYRAYAWGDWSRGQMGSGRISTRHTPQEIKVFE